MKGSYFNVSRRHRFSFVMADVRSYSGKRMLKSRSIADNMLSMLTEDVEKGEAIRALLLKLRGLSRRGQADQLAKGFVIAGMRRAEEQLREELRKMPITIDVMENSVFRDMILEGKAEGKAESLATILTVRFGPLPASAKAKIAQGSNEDLDRWIREAITAASLKQVLQV